MAIYSFHIEQISRGNAGNKIAKCGKSTVAMAAYRSAETLTDERTGTTYDYTGKEGVIHTEILAPENANEWVFNRRELWNAVENVEKRSNANLGRQVLIALPKELNREQQIELARKYFKDNFVDKGMVVDFAIHDKGDGNPHCHALITRRELEYDGFGEVRKDWVGGDFKGFVSDERKQVVLELRAAWAEYANRYLGQAGIEASIDHRSLKDQGIDDRTAEIHLGPNVKSMEDKGIETDRGNTNREIKQANAAMKDLKSEKVVVLNEYKAAKDEANRLKVIWSDFAPGERETILKAKDILKRYATLENIESGYRYQDNKLSFWYGLDEKLSRKMKPFNEANNILQELKDCRSNLKEAGLFTQDRKELKDKISYLEENFKNKVEYIEKYGKYGIYNEGSFKKFFNKLEAEELQKRNNYEQSRNNILAKKEVLYEAEEALKGVECKKFAQTYTDYEKYINKDNYAAAHSINEFNRLFGKKQSFDEIREIGDKAYHVTKDKERLDRAGVLLSEYEKLSAAVVKFDNGFNHIKRSFSQSSADEYNNLSIKFEKVKNELANCKVSDRADYVGQRELLSREIDSLPSLLKNYDLNNREKEHNSKLYQLYMERQRYKEANEFYTELKDCRNKLRNFNGSRDEKQEFKDKIRSLETSFLKCRVGSEKEFDYVAVVNGLEGKKKILEDQFRESIKNIDISEACKLACKARNSVVEIQNKKTIFEISSQGWIRTENSERKVVNENERRAGNVEGGHRRDPETYGRTGAVSSSGTGRAEGSPDQRSGYSESIPGISESRQREDSRKLQQNSGRNKYSSSENGREVLETTTGGTSEGSRFDEKQQVGDNSGAKTNDREVSTKDRDSAISKGNNSFISSRFKSNLPNAYSDTASRSQLNDQLRKQIEIQKAEMNKLSEDELQNTKEDKPDRSKPTDRER